MRRLSFLIAVVLLLCAGNAFAQSMGFSGPQAVDLIEGKPYTVLWLSSGGESVNVFIHGRSTPLGKTSRGDFIVPIAERIPAAQGQVAFKLPWIDSDKFFIKIKEYDGSGILIASAELEYGFRPAVLANRLKNGIYLDLHQRVNQRVYVQKNRRITHVYLCSSSENYRWLLPKSHPSVPHDHAGVFKVLAKNPDHYSKLYDVHMWWSMRYLSGHFIHATYPNLYKKLGRPASHGCNRLTRFDAEELYKATPIGTRVEVIGPKG